MTKILYRLLIFILLILKFTQASVDSERTYELNGVTMEAEDFKNAYGRKPEERTPPTTIQDAKLILEHIKIEEEKASFSVKICDEGRQIELSVEGELAAGYRTQRDMNSLIVKIPETVEGYKFLLVEAFLDSGKGQDNLFVGDNLELYTDKPHMRIYILHDSEQVYLFEGDVPKEFAGLEAVNYPPAIDDMHWAALGNLIEVYEGEIPLK